MEPYYRDELVTLYRGESLDVLRSAELGRLSALVTDPPYSSGGQFRSDRVQDTNTKYIQTGTKKRYQEFSGDSRDQRGWLAWCSIWLSQVYRRLDPNSYAMMFTDWRQLPMATDAFQVAGFNWRGLIAWDKTTASRAPHKGYVRHQCEYIVWGTVGGCIKRADKGPAAGCIRQRVDHREKRHACAKPVEVMRELVGFMRSDDVVLDPFAGSGSTLVAAKQLGIRAVGIECDDHACETAAAWLRETSPHEAGVAA